MPTIQPTQPEINLFGLHNETEFITIPVKAFNLINTLAVESITFGSFTMTKEIIVRTINSTNNENELIQTLQREWEQRVIIQNIIENTLAKRVETKSFFEANVPS